MSKVNLKLLKYSYTLTSATTIKSSQLTTVESHGSSSARDSAFSSSSRASSATYHQVFVQSRPWGKTLVTKISTVWAQDGSSLALVSGLLDCGRMHLPTTH